MSAASFISDELPAARIASARTGIPVSVILAQWGIETGWGTSKAFLQGNNFAGIMGAGGLRSYPDRTTGLADYISVMGEKAYGAVRGAGTSPAAATALGSSPWDAGHYQEGGGPPGSSLLSAISSNNLTRYDTGDVAPPPSGVDPGILGPPNGSGSGSGGGLGIVPAIANPLDPNNWTAILKKVGLYVLLVGGGVGLIIMGAYRGVAPIQRKVDQVKNQTGQAAAVAAMA